MSETAPPAILERFEGLRPVYDPRERRRDCRWKPSH